jgi:cell division protein FtsA
VLGDGGGQTIQRRKLCEIIEARMSEIYSLIGEEIKRSGHAGMLPAGVVLTGGGARIAGAAELAREVFQMPVRVGAPQGVGGLMDQLSNPAFSTPIGLLLWGAHHAGEEPLSYASASPFSGMGGRLVDWVRGLFPG